MLQVHHSYWYALLAYTCGWTCAMCSILAMTTVCTYFTGGACCRPVTLVSCEQSCLSHPDSHCVQHTLCVAASKTSVATHWVPHLLTSPSDSFCRQLGISFHCQSLPAYTHMILFFSSRKLGHIMMIEFSTVTSSLQFMITVTEKLLCIKKIIMLFLNVHHASTIKQLRKSFHK